MKSLKLYEIKKGKLVLDMLKNYGVLNMKTLSELLPEYKTLRNLKRTIKNLYERKLVVKRFEQINGRKSVFYQINQSPVARKAIGLYLDTHSENLKQRQVSYKELFHEQTVIKLAHYLKTNFPSAIVLRDHELINNDLAEKIISGLHSFEVIKPDILFIYNDVANDRQVAIAIEYEKSLKAKSRITQKLNFYTHRTKVDGVLYFYPESMIDHNLRHIYFNKIIDRSLRIKNYGQHFLLTSKLTNDFNRSFEILKNSTESNYSFKHWIDTLAAHDEYQRRNDYF
jgi:hypothetical protein